MKRATKTPNQTPKKGGEEEYKETPILFISLSLSLLRTRNTKKK